MRTQKALIVCLCFIIIPVAASAFTVSWGTSWDRVSLQEVLDAEYGAGVIDAATGYEGYNGHGADPAYWEDEGITGLVIREIAGNSNTNTMGWYEEDLMGPPVIDGIGDGVVIEGHISAGESVGISFPSGITRFSFYMNPNGTSSSGANAPEPELFFVNRFYNDLGPSGEGSPHEPFDGDPQCLIYNISHLNGGIPTYVLAWEDLDYGGDSNETDNDFQDFVVEIQAQSPVQSESANWGSVKAMFRD